MSNKHTSSVPMRAMTGTAVLPRDKGRDIQCATRPKGAWPFGRKGVVTSKSGKHRYKSVQRNMNRPDKEIVYEICHKGNVTEFLHTIKGMITEIHATGGRVLCCDVCSRSYFRYASQERKPNLVVLAFKYQRLDPLHLIWELLHLTGLHRLEKPEPHTPRLEMEKRVWDIAYHEWRKYPQLQQHEASFMKYKAESLRPYQEAWKGASGWNVYVLDFPH